MNGIERLLNNKGEYHRKLQEWYQEYRRELPWRTEPSVYKTVVSEFMLQQTQVVTMLPYFERWLKRFPDFKALAEAEEADVIKHWEGLGYYNRARNLHKLAKAINTREAYPQTALEWQKLPGVGPYTSAAIASISFGDPVPVVDGNVIRILSRLTHWEEAFKDNGAAVKALTPIAEKVMNTDSPNAYNQAVMELGATVCFRQKPMCMVCPVMELCEAAKVGRPEAVPNFLPKKTIKVEKTRIFWVHEGSLLLHKWGEAAKRLANMYELPECGQILKQIGKSKLLAKKQRGIGNQRITENIYEVKTTQARLAAAKQDEALNWVKLEELSQVTLSGPHRKWVEAILRAQIES